MQQQIVTLVGGTGFLGRYIVQKLARAGYALRVISRHPNAAIHLKTAGDPGQIALTYGDLLKPDTLKDQLSGSYAVINLTGILYESGRQNFSTLHAQGAEQLAKLAKAAKVKRFIHVSALGVDKAVASKYARTKITGEKAVAAAFPGASILRPGVVFGPEDDFFNRFAAMARKLPFLPLVGAEARFQPVYAGDVAKAVKALLEENSVQGKIYELGGPDILSMEQILHYIMDQTGHHRPLLPVPFGVAGLIALFMEWTPSPPLTRDQVRLLHYDNIVDGKALTLRNLNIAPTSLASVVPYYLQRRKPLSPHFLPTLPGSAA